MSVVEQLGQAVADVAERCGGRVVGVGPRWGLGSGIVVETGRILTNAHNVGDGDVTVTLADGRDVAASVLASDVDGDLAVLEADTGTVEPIEWADGPTSLGAGVVALANAGGRGLRATFGHVSGIDRAFRGPRGRRIAGALEHTAPMGRGSSGGPLLDAAGRLLGINTHRLGDGFYLAQPADATLRQRIDALARGESPQPPRLGIALTPDRAARRLRAAVGLPERQGVLVHDVDADSPAGRADLRRGDLLVAVGDRQITGTDDLLDALADTSPSEPLRVALVRGTEELTVDVTLEAEA